MSTRRYIQYTLYSSFGCNKYDLPLLHVVYGHQYPHTGITVTDMDCRTGERERERKKSSNFVSLLRINLPQIFFFLAVKREFFLIYSKTV